MIFLMLFTVCFMMSIFDGYYAVFGLMGMASLLLYGFWRVCTFTWEALHSEFAPQAMAMAGPDMHYKIEKIGKVQKGKGKYNPYGQAPRPGMPPKASKTSKTNKPKPMPQISAKTVFKPSVGKPAPGKASSRPKIQSVPKLLPISRPAAKAAKQDTPSQTPREDGVIHLEDLMK